MTAVDPNRLEAYPLGCHPKVRHWLSNSSEVGGPTHFVLTQPGNRFVSFVRARAAVCKVRMDLK